MSKKVVMLVFWGPKWPWEFFWVFWKKSKKSKKMRFFRKKAYGLRPNFVKSCVTIHHHKHEFFGLEKNVKKKGFSLFETFFLKWKLDIYFCPFLNLKKKFWKLKNFPFSPSHRNTLMKYWKNYQKILEKSNSCFQTSKNSFRVFWGSFSNFLI